MFCHAKMMETALALDDVMRSVSKNSGAQRAAEGYYHNNCSKYFAHKSAIKFCKILIK
jgi:hypothetical protein